MRVLMTQQQKNIPNLAPNMCQRTEKFYMVTFALSEIG